MAIAFLSSICSVAAKLAASIRSSSSSSSPSPSPIKIEDELDRLEKTVHRIQAVLSDAEEREIRDKSVELWLKELRDVAYEAEDVLEEYQSELLRVQAENLVAAAAAGAGTSLKRKREEVADEVCDLTYALSHLFIPERIRKIRAKFDEISKDREALQLRELDGSRRTYLATYPQPTSSHVDESDIFGRDQDKEAVIQMLLSDETCRFVAIPIVGMGGLGKTALAQIVYNDPRVRKYFNSMSWVCVSENFDVARITNEIVQSFTGQPCNITHLSTLQDALKLKAKEEKIFIVLDDVWNEEQASWDSLRAPFREAATLRIVLTTRNDSVAGIIQTVPPYRPSYLSHVQCWSLFRRRAFGAQDPEKYPELVDIGRRIIEKCGRLPLSVKTIGCLLRYGLDEDRWMQIFESDLWTLDQARKEILPALKLSYHHLPTSLKPCFLYSSVFPKHHGFYKDQLVKLWIAQGFIFPSGNKRSEDIGSEYFDELQRRSLFQSSVRSDKSTYYVLHDAIHDLARSISGGEYCSITLTDGNVGYISEQVRHLYLQLVGEATIGQLSFDNPGALRTLIVEWKYDSYMTRQQVLNFVNLDRFCFLRAVELERGGTPLLSSVGSLKHLRHLCARSYNDKDGLLESLCRLHNLQSLEMTFSRSSELFIDASHLIISGARRNSTGHINVGDGIFLRLQKLVIENNSKLTRLPSLPLFLRSLRICYCTNFTSFACLQNLAYLEEMHLAYCHQLQILQEDSMPCKLRIVHISGCWKLSVLAGLRNLTSLRSLELKSCPLLHIIPDDCFPHRPQHVEIIDCPMLKGWCEINQFDFTERIQQSSQASNICKL